MKVRDEFDQFCDDTGQIYQSLPTFCNMKEYPVGKSMKDRIIHAVTRFQAIWRGNVYKKAYPIARRQARATEAINVNKRVTLSTRTGGDRAMADALAEQKFLRENGPGDQVHGEAKQTTLESLRPALNGKPVVLNRGSIAGQ